MPSSSLISFQEWIHSNRSQWIKEYKEFLSIPSISSEADYKQEMENCLVWLTDYLKAMHFQVEQWPTAGHPVLFASYMQAGPQQPTLLIYNHYDVQPVDPLEEWLSPPFEPTIREEQMYARGAQDNKGQCFYVLQALKMLQAQTGTLPLNIKLCIEGEEEIGSAGLSHLLQEKKEQLKADYLAIVDLGLRDAQVPALTLGMRGLVTFNLEVKSAQTDLHSGSHGGIALNPIHVLVQLLADLRDAKGKITIPDFYDDVIEMSAEERANVSFQFSAEEYQRQTGAQPLGGEENYAVLERAWLRPTLEVNGIHGGYTGTGFKTVIPARAQAKFSCRLVPNQQPAEIGALVAAYLKKQAPAGIEIKVEVNPGQGKPVRVSPHSKVVRSFAQAFEEIGNVPCEFILEGASIPIVAELTEVSQAEVLLMGLGLITDQIHAPNEHFGLDRLEKGMLVMARAIQILAQR